MLSWWVTKDHAVLYANNKDWSDWEGWSESSLRPHTIFYAPAIFNGGPIVSPLSVRTSVPSVRPVRNTNCFRAISFERIGVLDWNFIHRCIIIKFRSSSIEGKIHQLFWKLWPFFTLKTFQLWKMVSVQYLLKGLVYWIEILYTSI